MKSQVHLLREQEVEVVDTLVILVVVAQVDHCALLQRLDVVPVEVEGHPRPFAD